MLGTSTRTSDVLINLGLSPLRRLREVGSPQFGVLSARAPPSPRCTALTAASCENHGAAPNYGTRVPGIFGGTLGRMWPEWTGPEEPGARSSFAWLERRNVD